jgi:hypothetical protein
MHPLLARISGLFYKWTSPLLGFSGAEYFLVRVKGRNIPNVSSPILTYCVLRYHFGLEYRKEGGGKDCMDLLNLSPIAERIPHEFVGDLVPY